MRRELERIPVPDAEAARERAREVVLEAYAAREPVPTRRASRRLVAVCAILATVAVVGAAFSPPGEAVVDRIREVVGVERAQPTLFRLPTGGSLLVVSDAGVWVVEQNGKKRLLGTYREASWSPFGRFVVAAKPNELAALEPGGDVRWTLARRNVSAPRWTGSESNTRIAYLSAGALRVVGGDGRGDRLVRPRVHAVAPAWRPHGFVLTYVDRSGAVVTEDLERRAVLWRKAYERPVLQLVWSADGRRLVVRQPRRIDVLTREGVLLTGVRPNGALLTASAVRPGLHEHTHALTRDAAAQVLHVGEGGGRLFAGRGRFSDLSWSPDGRWLLVGWPAADQWVFVRADGTRIRASADVSAQFRSRAFPRVEGWCC